jgi:hypothetical protein
MKDPRMKGVESSQPGFAMLKKGAMKKSERRSIRHSGSHGRKVRKHSSKY